MAKIYSERETSELYHSTGEPGVGVEARRVAGYGKQLEAQSEQYERRAKETYSTALKIEATDTMTSLYRQYSDDPVALQNAFKKAYDKSIGSIADEDVKVDFMANVSLQSQSYITKAIENKKRKDYRIAKSTAFDGIDRNTEALGLAFSTLLGTDFNPDNVVVYNNAMASNERMINLLNDDGTFMFTDEQRKEKRKAMDKAHLLALKGNFYDLAPYQKENYLKLLSEDRIEIPVGVDKDKNIIKKNLQEIISPESYEKFKEYAEMVAKKKKTISSKDTLLSEEEAWQLADTQMANSILVESEMNNIKDIKKDEPVERVLRNLELQDNIQQLGYVGLSESGYNKYRKETVKDLVESLKNEENVFDDALFQESAMSIGLQALKKDGKIGGNSWGDSMSVVMIRDFYNMAKESNLDLRATDSGSREAAKKLAQSAITNTIERVEGGYGKEYNSIFINGSKISKQPIKRGNSVGYADTDYTITNGKKRYNETGIEVDL